MTATAAERGEGIQVPNIELFGVTGGGAAGAGGGEAKLRTTAATAAGRPLRREPHSTQKRWSTASGALQEEQVSTWTGSIGRPRYQGVKILSSAPPAFTTLKHLGRVVTLKMLR